MGNIQQILGDNIRRFRNSRGWTQVYLADALGIAPSFLTLIESGKRGMSLGMVERFSDFFGVSAASLFIDRTKNPENEKDNYRVLRNVELENLKARLSSQVKQVIEFSIDEFKFRQ